RQQILDQLLQLDAVVPQDRRYFALRAVQLADSTVHQQLGTFANTRERRREIVRHVAQEALAFLRELQQSHAQPLELPTEILEVRGTAHRDRFGERSLAELADGVVYLSDRAQQNERKDSDERRRKQDHRGGLPEQILLGFGSRY